MKKKKTMYLEGSMTIETALLMPFILFLIWNLLFLSFFLYDQCVGLQGCYTTALRTERWLGSDSEKEAEAFAKYKDVITDIMACARETGDLNVTDKDVVVGTTINMDAPGSPLYDSSWEGSHKMKADEWKPVKYIRNIRKAEKAVEKLSNNDN